jgi:hypothetical protein
MSNYLVDLDRAVIILAQSRESLQQRLFDAWVKLSSFALINESGESGEIREKLEEIQNQVERAGGAESFFRGLDDTQAANYISRIVSLYAEANRSEPVGAGD